MRTVAAWWLRAVKDPLARARQTLRREPYDTSTPEGRSQERDRRAAWTTLTTVAARVLEVVLALLTIPLTIGYLGKEHYGLWMVLSSLLTWANLADLGLLRGLQNHLSDAYGRDDEAAAGRSMATAFFALSLLALVLGAAGAVALWTVPWASVLRISDPSLERELLPALGATGAVFLLQFPLKIGRQAYAAYQRGHVANVFAAVGSVASFAALIAAMQLRLGLPWLILATGGVTALVALGNLLWLTRDLPFLLPKPSRIARDTLQSLLQVSAPMLVFELAALLINEVQLFIIARDRGVGEVTDYSVYLKVMSIPLFLVNSLDAPYAPMYREALARGDRAWLRQAFYRIARSKLALSLALGLVLVATGDAMAGALSNQNVRFGPAVWALGGVVMVAGCWNGGYNNLFMAVERLWTLVLVVLGNAAVTVVLTLVLTRDHGIRGVLVASGAYSLLLSSWLLPALGRDVLRAPDADETPTPDATASVPSASAPDGGG
ncbi:MAG: lipopolysaccharide biosynthesis protein [Myxococcales bacterium]|nr:MAG: lipopolysaccharide biosynthesis protein [Myxococcales bacterium]